MKRLRNLLLSVIIGCIFSIPFASLQAAPPGTTAYIKDRILLRIEPKPTARVTATLAAGVRVRVNHCAEGWCSVTTQGLTGYVLEKFLVRAMSRPPAKR
jgi:SH3-like domain-containing protein